VTDSPRPQWLGRLGYAWAWRLQHLRREAIVAGTAPEAHWLLEHPSVITTGRREVAQLPSREELARRGTEVVHTERGGLATWHGPGQLVGYLMLDLGRRQVAVPALVGAVEAGLIEWLQARGVDAGCRAGAPGVWVGSNKIASLGFHIRHHVTMHGFALNLCPDLSGFDGFVPCGVAGAGVTSVLQATGRRLQPHSVAEDVGQTVLGKIDAVTALTPPGGDDKW